jgi:hypothetical protein
MLNILRCGITVYIVVPAICLAAWLTHVIFCLQDGRWGFLIAGALVFPIAIIHGIGLWLGVFH